MVGRFRFRVFALIVLVALAATGATAWLTARATTAQFAESAAVEKQTSDLIHQTITEYGVSHGTWEGVPAVVRGLGERTGQRIRLTSLDGIVIADTDTLAGRTARAPSTKPATVIDARVQDPRPVAALEPIRIAAYRQGLRTAACLTRDSVPFQRDIEPVHDLWIFHLTRQPGPQSLADADAYALKRCSSLAMTASDDQVKDQATWASCLLNPDPAGTPQPRPSAATYTEGPGSSSLAECAARVFTERVEPYCAPPLQLKLGYGVDHIQQAPISERRVLAAAGSVALLVIVSTVLLTRRMLLSIEELGRAARRLAAGDRAWRARIRGDDEIAGLTAAFNQMADSLQRSEERQRRMINDIAHELRTPLANIRGYLEALHDGVLPPDRDLFASLHEEAVLQQRLIDDLQELALAEAGGLQLNLGRVNVGELLELCRTTHLVTAEAQGVRLALEIDQVPEIDADPDRLRQALGNLVTNALRATPAGGTVTLAAVREGQEVAISVRDTGHGIDPDHLDHVFDRFWRADSARGRDTGGRGLGLAITREIVLAHGGLITATSVPGRGSAFTLRLPCGRTGMS